ncbi:MAG TPA: OsmC family protein [Gemmatimonadota bacterium]|nr:OsmC family protein [Gemmatimonadota bacterium]
MGGALEARGIPSHPDRLSSEVEGRIIDDDGTLRIASIHVHYHIAVPAGQREAAERALEVHREHCPVAVTLTPCVDIQWDADIEEIQT